MIQNQLQGSKRSATQREPRPKIKRTLELNRKLKARPTKFKTETNEFNQFPILNRETFMHPTPKKTVIIKHFTTKYIL